MAPPDGASLHAEAAEHTPLREADNRLLRHVDALSDDGLTQPSLLPGWSRGHVVAHVALHAEAASRVLEGVLHGERVPMYPSVAERDAAIDALAAASGETVRDRLLAGTARFRALLDRPEGQQWDARFSRVPGEPGLPVRVIPAARRVEVEVHHADLDVGYGPGDWPDDLAVALLERTLDDRAGSGPLGLYAEDLGRTWWLDGPADDVVVVSGPVAALAWWLAGRGDRTGLHASPGRPPSLGRWR